MISKPTFFGKQSSNCKIKPGVTEKPTQEEIDLSCIVRNGMRGGCEIKQILNPGSYMFNAEKRELESNYSNMEVTLKRAGTTERPNLVNIKSAIWREEFKQDWNVTISGFTNSIPVPVEDASDYKVAYYGCRVLHHGDNIHLSQRSIMVDFIYGKDYFEEYVIKVNGGSGIEHHSFAHVDTPLDDESGHLVLGKVYKDTGELDLTAFKVPKGMSIYIPADAVHSNDYFLGRWETVISPACNFPSAKMKGIDREALRLDIK